MIGNIMNLGRRIYAALHNGPAEVEDSELRYPGYKRVPIDLSSAMFNIRVNAATLKKPVYFPECKLSYDGMATHVVFYTEEGGILCEGPLVPAIVIDQGRIPSLTTKSTITM